MKLLSLIESTKINEHIKGGFDSFYQLTKAKKLAKADGHNYDKLPEFHRGADQPHKQKYMALAKEKAKVKENVDDQYELFVDGKPATTKLYNKKEINTVEQQWQMKFPKKKIEFKLVNKYAMEGEERTDIKDLMIPKIKEYLHSKGPGSYISLEDLESDLYDYARQLTHDDLKSSDDLRNFTSNPGDEASSAVGELLSGMYKAEFDDYITTEGRIEEMDMPDLSDDMIGTPDDFYDAEQRQEAFKDLKDATDDCRHDWQKDTVIDGICPECSGSSCMDGDDENGEDSCYGWGNFGCDGGEMTQRDDGLPNWAEIIKHDKRKAERDDAKANYPGDEEVVKGIANMVKNMDNPRDAMQQMAVDYPQMGRRQRADLVAKGMKLAGLTKEGKSPHKKGTAKHKKHMAAMHAGMGESINEDKWKEIETTSDYMMPVSMNNQPLDFPTYWEWEQSHGETNKNRASLRYGNYVNDAKQELSMTTEGEQHGNSKIYKKCWTGYSKVAGKKAGEKGSCKKNEGTYDWAYDGAKLIDKHDKPEKKKEKKEETIQAGDELMIETADGEGIIVPILHVVKENVLIGWDDLAEDIVIEGARQLEELRKLAGLDQINEITDESAKEVIMQILNSYGKDADLETEFRNYFPRLSDDEVDYYLKGYKKPELKLVKNEAEYQGRKVKLGKPTRGDSKKFKVYVKDPKTGNVKKVNFGHGGTSAKKAGQKTMKIKKSNPARRKSFRARHNCDNPGPRTKARYWSCRAW